MTRPFKRPPPTSPEAVENRLVSLAYDLAEKQLTEGTASPTTINHFLKLGSTRAELEKTKLENENALLHVRAENIASQARSEEKYDEVIQAIRRYSGHQVEDEEDSEDYYYDD